MARVIAIEAGHDGFCKREVGEVFTVPDERLKDGSTWFVLADKAPQPKATAPKGQPPGAGPLKGSRARAADESSDLA